MSYKTFQISDGISLIQETHVANFMRCNIWHIKGQEFDLIIDTGMVNARSETITTVTNLSIFKKNRG